MRLRPFLSQLIKEVKNMNRKLAKVKLNLYLVPIKFFGWLSINVIHSEVCVTKNGQTVYYGSGHEGGHVGLPSAGQPFKFRD